MTSVMSHQEPHCGNHIVGYHRCGIQGRDVGLGITGHDIVLSRTIVLLLCYASCGELVFDMHACYYQGAIYAHECTYYSLTS